MARSVMLVIRVRIRDVSNQDQFVPIIATHLKVNVAKVDVNVATNSKARHVLNHVHIIVTITVYVNQMELVNASMAIHRHYAHILVRFYHQQLQLYHLLQL